MDTKPKITTDEAAPQRFRPHGRVEFSIKGNLLISEVIGPFNAELIKALESTGVGAFDAFIARGKWGDVIIFRDSAIASSDIFAALTRNVSKNIAEGRHPWATALVLSPQVEGAKLMTHLYLNCFLEGGYTQRGIPIQVFETEDAAITWMTSTLEQLA